METLKGLNIAVRFLLELCVLAAVGYWGFKTGSGWFLKILLGIGAPFLIAFIWGTFGAPQANMQLHGLTLLVLEIIVFGSGVAALYVTKNYSLAWGFAAIVIVNRVLMFVWEQ
jgi:quinol-cytochrome oxidoreductase complex cytochrome b subunit